LSSFLVVFDEIRLDSTQADVGKQFISLASLRKAVVAVRSKIVVKSFDHELLGGAEDLENIDIDDLL
jgi:Mg2+/Co2+ transporter CorB